jgi:hypothetical protein
MRRLREDAMPQARATARPGGARAPRSGLRASGFGGVLSARTLFGFTGPRAPSRTMLAYDASLAWASLVLLAIGLVMVYSSSIAMAESSSQTGHRSWYYLARHGAFLGVGLCAALGAFQVPVKAW